MSDILERQGMKAEDLAHLTSPYIYPDPLQPGDSAVAVCGTSFVLKNGTVKIGDGINVPLHAVCSDCVVRVMLLFNATKEQLLKLAGQHIWQPGTLEVLQTARSAIEDFYGHSLPSTKEAQG